MAPVYSIGILRILPISRIIIQKRPLLIPILPFIPIKCIFRPVCIDNVIYDIIEIILNNMDIRMLLIAVQKVWFGNTEGPVEAYAVCNVGQMKDSPVKHVYLQIDGSCGIIKTACPIIKGRLILE